MKVWTKTSPGASPRPARPATWVRSWKVRSPARKSGMCRARSALMIPTRVTLGKCRPFAIIWVPTRMSILPAAKGVEGFAEGVFAGHGVGVHAPDDGFGEDGGDVRLDLLGAETGVDERVFAAFGAAFWDGGAVAAEVATQAASCRWKVSATLQFGHSRTCPQLLQRSEVAKPRRLRKRMVCSFFSSRSVIAVRSFSDKIGGGFFFPAFHPQVDDADERHLAGVDPLGELAEDVFAALGVVITLQRRGGGREQDDAFLHFSPDDGDVAGVVAGRFFLLVGGLVFFVDDDEADVLERGEDGAAGADHDPGAAGVELVPFVVPLAFRQVAVEDRDHVGLGRRNGS